ncbi:MAG: hypothetical protein ACR2ID_06755 [Chthoniobacterales bacterium]
MRQPLAANSTLLRAEQADALWQVMVDERARTPASTASQGNASGRAGMLSDPARAEEFYRTQASYDQPSALAAFQKQRLEMQKMGMEMARKMMGNGEAPSMPGQGR